MNQPTIYDLNHVLYYFLNRLLLLKIGLIKYRYISHKKNKSLKNNVLYVLFAEYKFLSVHLFGIILNKKYESDYSR
ncbi:MAG: hypothetical protein N2203_02165 [Bacteroidia bacterium]|nr:hypothetical protein [Bacteroidia bacterium]